MRDSRVTYRMIKKSKAVKDTPSIDRFAFFYFIPNLNKHWGGADPLPLFLSGFRVRHDLGVAYTRSLEVNALHAPLSYDLTRKPYLTPPVSPVTTKEVPVVMVCWVYFPLR